MNIAQTVTITEIMKEFTVVSTTEYYFSKVTLEQGSLVVTFDNGGVKIVFRDGFSYYAHAY